MTIFTGVCFLGLLITGLNYGALLKGPINTIAKVGDTVKLLCTTDLEFPVYWYFGEPEIFYGGKVSLKYSSMFQIESANKGEYNLIIPQADPSYSGVYTCGDNEGEGEKRRAWLYVEDTLTTTNYANNSTIQSGGSSSTTIIIVIIAVAGAIACIVVIALICYKRSCANDAQRGSNANEQPFPNTRPPAEERGGHINSTNETEENINSGVDMRPMDFHKCRQVFDQNRQKTGVARRNIGTHPKITAKTESNVPVNSTQNNAAEVEETALVTEAPDEANSENSDPEVDHGQQITDEKSTDGNVPEEDDDAGHMPGKANADDDAP